MKINRSYAAQRGTVLVEYSVVTLIVVMALFIPLPGFQDSLINLVMDALRQFQSHTMLLLSLP